MNKKPRRFIRAGLFPIYRTMKNFVILCALCIIAKACSKQTPPSENIVNPKLAVARIVADSIRAWGCPMQRDSIAETLLFLTFCESNWKPGKYSKNLTQVGIFQWNKWGRRAIKKSKAEIAQMTFGQQMILHLSFLRKVKDWKLVKTGTDLHGVNFLPSVYLKSGNRLFKSKDHDLDRNKNGWVEKSDLAAWKKSRWPEYSRARKKLDGNPF